jgi:uncharacterized protein YrrD
MKVSDLNNKPVITVPGGEIVGTVADVLMHSVQQRVGALVIKSARFAAPQIVLTKDIGGIGGDAVTIGSIDKLKDQTRFGESNQMVSAVEAEERQVATASGNYLGKLSDILIDPVTGHVTGFEVTGGLFARMFGRTHVIEASEHTRLGKDFLIVADEVVPEQTDPVIGE